jgi:hypothetical protein
MDLKERERENMDLIHVAGYRDQRRVLVSTVISEISCPAKQLLTSQERLCSTELVTS